MFESKGTQGGFNPSESAQHIQSCLRLPRILNAFNNLSHYISPNLKKNIFRKSPKELKKMAHQ